ncbi:hypothetical protein VNI00_018055 [Paramarasmius palmivorus]|uniref:Uncharacterized protein n=1 Tax=Paramarasmius palmivorus TaxID=297713 RepID=A0AAW0B2G5_9AGAR
MEYLTSLASRYFAFLRATMRAVVQKFFSWWYSENNSTVLSPGDDPSPATLEEEESSPFLINGMVIEGVYPDSDYADFLRERAETKGLTESDLIFARLYGMEALMELDELEDDDELVAELRGLIVY